MDDPKGSRCLSLVSFLRLCVFTIITTDPSLRVCFRFISKEKWIIFIIIVNFILLSHTHLFLLVKKIQRTFSSQRPGKVIGVKMIQH